MGVQRGDGAGGATGLPRPFVTARKTMPLRKAAHCDFSRRMKSEAVSIRMKLNRRPGPQGRIPLTHHANEIR